MPNSSQIFYLNHQNIKFNSNISSQESLFLTHLILLVSGKLIRVTKSTQLNTANLVGGVVDVILDKVDAEDLPEVLSVAAQGHEPLEVLREQAVGLGCYSVVS